MFRLNDIWLSYGPWTCIFCSNFKLSGLFFDVLWYIDLIFGMCLYLDELQFKFEFRSGRITFGWVMAIELVFFVQILSCPYFFLTSFDIFDLIFGMWLYLDELQFNFEFCSGWMTFDWVMAIELIFFVQILSCPYFSLTSFDILTWYLICCYI